MTYSLSARSKDNLKGIDADIIALVNLALTRSPIDFGIPTHGGLRTAAVQKSLFDKGVSRCDGTRNKSAHQSGKAFDFYAYTNGVASWDAVHLAILYGVFAACAVELNLTLIWGGTFGSDSYHGWDMGHIEVS